MRRGKMKESVERKMASVKAMTMKTRKGSYQPSALLIAIASGLACLAAAHKQTYEGYSLYRCQPQTSYQVERLRLLRDDKMNNEEQGAQFWSEPSSANNSVDIMLAPEDQDHTLEEFRNFRIPCKMLMYDVGEVIRRTSAPQVVAAHRGATYRDGSGNLSAAAYVWNQQYVNLREARQFYSQFHPYSIIEAKLNELAKSPMVTLKVAGYSSERRPLYLVQVSSDRAAQKPVIFIDAGHHAREWISHSTLLYLIDSLVNPDGMRDLRVNPVRAAKSSSSNGDDELAANFSSSSSSSSEKTRQSSNSMNRLRATLDKYDFWFLPVVNPDGYEYTHRTNRLWRKTRSSSGICSGADPNRNYNFHWRETGADAFTCSETYAGSKPLSEPEAAVVAGILDSNSKRIAMYITLHSYSQMMLVPYGYAKKYPHNFSELERVAVRGMDAIQDVRGTRYTFGVASILLYEAAGGSDDYAHGVSNIKLVYTMELPDLGRYGFLMPPSEIIPVGHETVEGIGAMVEAI